ncbi:hypothetical protein V6N12_070146 [Hibiscus sabdariffa]|uniref:Uncharacterized protein n=1 Tax=Hibiscus sabdariffa TaxID=183260 RepID=A0ABR2FFY1_9ROSI
MFHDKNVVTKKGGDGLVKSSFRDMLTGRRAEGSNVHAIPELDVVIDDEDVQISSSGGTSVIKFSDQLHDLVDEKLAKSVIVWLLGRSTGKSRRESRGKYFDATLVSSSKQGVVGAGKFDVLVTLEPEFVGGVGTKVPPTMGNNVPESTTSPLMADV